MSLAATWSSEKWETPQGLRALFTEIGTICGLEAFYYEAVDRNLKSFDALYNRVRWHNAAPVTWGGKKFIDQANYSTADREYQNG